METQGSKSELICAIEEFNVHDIVKIIFSGGKKDIKKAVIRPVKQKKVLIWQVEKNIKNQAFHENIEFNNLLGYIEDNFSDSFKQINVITKKQTAIILISQKGKIFKKITENECDKVADFKHNKEKQYILKEGQDIAPLRDLGIFDSENQIIKAKYDKYKQINRFVEIIDDEFKNFNNDEITVLDFGCGKSYLTFVVYYYFKFVKNLKVKVVGYDLKEDVVNSCNQIAAKYCYNDLSFVAADVSKDNGINFKVDMMITLHACDTATDYALYFAIKNNVNYIFSVPCCQHEINSQINCTDEMNIMLTHGLIKERFSALLTDSVRCELLKQQGYDVDVLEFVDFSHSPKNLMIRARKANCNSNKNTDNNIMAQSISLITNSESFKILKKFGVSQKLYSLLCEKS